MAYDTVVLSDHVEIDIGDCVLIRCAGYLLDMRCGDRQLDRHIFLRRLAVIRIRDITPAEECGQ